MYFGLHTVKGTLLIALIASGVAMLVGLPLAAISTHSGGPLFYLACVLIWPIWLATWIGDSFLSKDFVDSQTFWIILLCSQVLGNVALTFLIRMFRERGRLRIKV